ncbi:unnamed protein product, partial [Brassica rapa]
MKVAFNSWLIGFFMLTIFLFGEMAIAQKKKKLTTNVIFHYETKVEHAMPTSVKPHVSKGIKKGKVHAQLIQRTKKCAAYVCIFVL